MNPTTEERGWTSLVPFDRREGLSLKEAADVAGKSGSTIRAWCQRDGIGRRIGGGTWVVSRLALRMFLDGDGAASRRFIRSPRRRERGVRACSSRCGAGTKSAASSAQIVRMPGLQARPLGDGTSIDTEILLAFRP